MKSIKYFILICSIISSSYFFIGYVNNSKEELDPKYNIILAAVPKSGSEYISKSIEDSLHYQHKRISPGYIPSTQINDRELKEFFSTGGLMTKHHIDASTLNTQLLNQYTNKIVVHVRDPRQVLLSWVYYLESIYRAGNNEQLLKVAPTPPPEYFNWDIAKKIDWNIDNFLPNIVTWTNDWIAFKQREDRKGSGFKILITTYDELLVDELNLYNKILSFYEIPKEKFNFKKPALDGRVNYRKAEPDEWRTVFTEHQKQKIAKIVPNELLREFNWQQ